MPSHSKEGQGYTEASVCMFKTILDQRQPDNCVRAELFSCRFFSQRGGTEDAYIWQGTVIASLKRLMC